MLSPLKESGFLAEMVAPGLGRENRRWVCSTFNESRRELLKVSLEHSGTEGHVRDLEIKLFEQ